MRQLLLCLGLCILLTPYLTAQTGIPRGVVNDLITDLKEQGYAQRLQKGYEFLTGIENKNGPPCTSKDALITQIGRSNSSSLRPPTNHYWVSINRRKELLMVKGDGTIYSVYGQVKILEQVDPFTYKVEELFCECINCTESDGDSITISWCELDIDKQTCVSNGKNCRLVRRVRYYCGRLIYSK